MSALAQSGLKMYRRVALSGVTKEEHQRYDHHNTQKHYDVLPGASFVCLIIHRASSF